MRSTSHGTAWDDPVKFTFLRRSRHERVSLSKTTFERDLRVKKRCINTRIYPLACIPTFNSRHLSVALMLWLIEIVSPLRVFLCLLQLWGFSGPLREKRDWWFCGFINQIDKAVSFPISLLWLLVSYLLWKWKNNYILCNEAPASLMPKHISDLIYEVLRRLRAKYLEGARTLKFLSRLIFFLLLSHVLHNSFEMWLRCLLNHINDPPHHLFLF